MTHGLLFCASKMEEIDPCYFPADKTKLSFNQIFEIKELNNAMRVKRMERKKTLSGNKINMRHVLTLFSAGTHLMKAGSNNSAGFVNNTHVIVHAKAIEIFDFLDDSKWQVA